MQMAGEDTLLMICFGSEVTVGTVGQEVEEVEVDWPLNRAKWIKASDDHGSIKCHK